VTKHVTLNDMIFMGFIRGFAPYAVIKCSISAFVLRVTYVENLRMLHKIAHTFYTCVTTHCIHHYGQHEWHYELGNGILRACKITLKIVTFNS
jgi:hypothetical protein